MSQFLRDFLPTLVYNFGLSECKRVVYNFGLSECNQVVYNFGLSECNRVVNKGKTENVRVVSPESVLYRNCTND